MKAQTLRSRLQKSGAALVWASVCLMAAPIEASDGAPHCGISDDGPDGAVPRRRGGFDALPDVTLSNRVEAKLDAIAAVYARKTGQTFVVTSGTRDAESQADAIYEKLVLGEDVLRLYKDKAAAAELKRVYDLARAGDRSRSDTVRLMAATIRSQMKRGIFISAHLRAGAADVRSSTMSAGQRRAFVDASRDVGGVSITQETLPPHFHLQVF